MKHPLKSVTHHINLLALLIPVVVELTPHLEVFMSPEKYKILIGVVAILNILVRQFKTAEPLSNDITFRK